MLSPKVKGHVLGICVLHDTFATVLIFAPVLRCIWLNLYSLDILQSSGKHSLRWDDWELNRYVIKLPDMFDLRGQVFVLHHFLCLSSGEVVCQGNCWTTTNALREFRLPPWSIWELHSSGLLRSENWKFLTDVSGQPIGSIVKVKERKEERTSYYNCCFIPSVNEQYIKSLEIDFIINYLSMTLFQITYLWIRARHLITY